MRNTDGVALTQAGFGPFAAGAFYAGHDDGDVAAFSWSAPTRWGCAKTARLTRWPVPQLVYKRGAVEVVRRLAV